jgi:YYY domain-containing protein
MPFTDVLSILQWWTVLFFIGLIFLPLISIIFSSFFDRGYIFAKILGMLLISYTSWFLGSLGIASFSVTSLFIIWLLFALLASLLIYKGKTPTHLLRSSFKMFIFEELLFTSGLFFWAYVRAHEPSIHGLEKFMDFGFMNSILRSDYFAPKDIWMTPLTINYYYFGHLVTAVMIKISNLAPTVGYNLMLATLFGITLAGAFSIGANLFHLFISSQKPNKGIIFPSSRWIIISGLISAFLVTLGGNLHTIYLFFQTYPTPENPLPFWQLPFGWNPSTYWYPNATRFIPFTIHEFPIYSFVVADLHGHVLDIPFVLLALALITKVYHQAKLLLLDYLLFGLLIATFLMTNVLDGPIYILAILIVLFAFQLRKQPQFSRSLVEALKTVGIVTLLAVIFSLPFWMEFKPFASGIGVLCSPQFLVDKGKIGPFLFEAEHCQRSPLWMMSLLWGFFYFVLFGFLYFILRERKRREATHFIVTDNLALVLSLIATILIIIPEFFYAKDIYPAHYRANTVFKFGYQAFMIFGLIGGYMIARTLTTKRSLWYLIVGGFLFTLVAIYPNFAINSYYGDLRNYQSLDGLQWLNNQYPDDYQALIWIQNNIKGQPIMLEAQGDSYTDYARISANSGLPTVIGWGVHEWLWRGSYDEPGKRVGEVSQIYESTDLNLTADLIKKYKISYVYVGDLERQKYKALNENKFQALGKIVFQSGNTKIYQINP